jgi:hypothetical protein
MASREPSAAAIIREVVLESFDMVGRRTGPAVAYRLGVACDDYPYETSWLLPSLTTGLLLPRPALTKRPSWVLCGRSLSALLLATSTSLQSLIPSAVCDSDATVDVSDVLITSSNAVPVMSSTKSMRNESSIIFECLPYCRLRPGGNRIEPASSTETGWQSY